MKRKDIALIVAIAGVAAIVSFVVSGQIFVTSAKRSQSVEKVEPISTTFTVPDSRFFNTNSIDPTQNIQIGTTTNPAPFSSGTQ